MEHPEVDIVWVVDDIHNRGYFHNCLFLWMINYRNQKRNKENAKI